MDQLNSSFAFRNKRYSQMDSSSDTESKSSCNAGLLDDNESQLSSSMNQSICTTYDSFNLPPRIKTPDPAHTNDLLELAELAGIPIPDRLGRIMIQMLNEGAPPSGIVSVLNMVFNNKKVKRVPNDDIMDSRPSTPASCLRRSKCPSTVTTCTTASDFSIATEYLDRCNLMSQASPLRANTGRSNELFKLDDDMLHQWNLTEE